MHLQPAWLQIGITLVGGVALALLILQVLASGQHGFIAAGGAYPQTSVTNQATKP